MGEAERLIQPALLSGEHVLWVGRPQRLWIDPQLARELIGFGIALALALFALRVYGTFATGNYFYLALFGIGLNFIILLGHALRQIQSNITSTFILSTYRLIINRTGWTESQKSFDLKKITNISLESGRGGKGVLYLTPAADYSGAPPKPFALRGIAEVRQVYELLLAAKDKASIRETPVLTETPVSKKSRPA